MTTPPAVRFRDRLLAEATRALENASGARHSSALADDGEAVRRAEKTDGPLERRITVRAGHLPSAASLREALRRVKHAVRVAVIIGLVVALISGGAAALGVLGPVRDQPVNFYWTLMTLLGVQTLLLLVWLALIIIGPRAVGSFSIGSLLAHGGRWLALRLDRGTHEVAAVRAYATVLGSTRSGAWMFSAISHGFWTAFNLGCITLLFILLSARQYTFGWETTILSVDAYETLTRAIAELPRAIGFDGPSDAEIKLSQLPARNEVVVPAREAWSGLLIGAMAVYGLGVRVIALTICVLMAVASRRAWRLDATLPGFAELRPRLEPAAVATGVIDTDDAANGAHHMTAQTPQAPAPRPLGPPAMLGFEIASPRGGWPPVMQGGAGAARSAFDDLGLIDDRAARAAVLERLRCVASAPRLTIVAVSLTATPDRGVRSFLQETAAASSGPVALVLSGGESLRQRTDVAGVEARVEDWRHLAHDAGVAPEHIIELDLDHLTGESTKRLHALLQVEQDNDAKADGGTSSVGEAFALIAERAERWTQREAPLEEQAKLHREIAAIYRRSVGGDLSLLLPRELARALRSADARSAKEAMSGMSGAISSQARRMIELLPPSLQRSPKWLAAGAVTGALGCVAAASLIAPIAIAALPTWSAIGAAVSFALQPKGSKGNDRDMDAHAHEATVHHSLDQAVRSATMLTLLLELQGQGEAVIARVLDASFAGDDDDDDALVMHSSADAERWLDDARERFASAARRQGVLR